MSTDILTALEALSSAELNKIRLRLWQKFGRQLRDTPDAPTPDDLLHEAIEDLLADRRHCPLELVELAICIVNIVRSKVSHIYEKWKREGIVKVSDNILNTYQGKPEKDSELRDKILNFVADDPFLRRIVEYRLDYPEARAGKIARALNVDIQEMYKANRRLKARLKHVTALGPADTPQGGAKHVAAQK